MLHMIGNAHIDPVWLWRWQDGCAEAISTCWAAIDRLKETSGFVFTKGEAAVYRWIKELDPPLFAAIQGYVAQGRWVVVNGWWIQPDCNIPSGEAILRQALYGKAWFRDNLGVSTNVGYNVDSFGHAGTFPMLLRHTGYEHYTFQRPEAHEKTLPGEFFDWVSPDGSRLSSYRIQITYGPGKREIPLSEIIDRHLELEQQVGHSLMCFYGVGNHGGGPTIANLQLIEARRAEGQPLQYSHPSTYFEAMRMVARPEVHGELQFHAIGCYAAGAELKQLNRRAEAVLEQAEAAAALARLHTGTPYPRERFEALWQTLLFNQFHDTMGGTSIEPACEDAVFELGGVISGAEHLLNAAVRRLDTLLPGPVSQDDATVVLMNFNGADCDQMVECEPWIDKDSTSKRLLLDEAGQPVPFQYVNPHAKTRGMQRLAFRLNVPAFGHRVLRYVRHDDGVPCPPGVVFGRPIGLDALTFSTGGYRLRLDRQTGAIASLVNLQSGLESFTGPGHLAIAVADATDTWSHGVDRFGNAGETARLIGLNLIEEGDVRLTLEVVTQVANSSVRTTIVLPHDPELPVELRVAADWREQHKLLRLCYPLGAETFEYEVAGGWASRPADGQEVPGHRWVRALSGTQETVLVNDAKYSYAAADGTLYITALRSPPYAHHVPIAIAPGAAYRYMDQGEQVFRLRLMTARSVERAQASTLADNLLKPAVTTAHTSRGGQRPGAGRWLDVTAEKGAILGSLKGAENGQGMVLRAFQLEDHAGRISHRGSRWPIRARGILSLRIDGDTVAPCDGLEVVAWDCTVS